MKLIKDLGMRLSTPNSKKPVRFGLYECPCCHTHFEVQVQSVKSGNTTKCNACARKLVGDKKKLFDSDYPKLYNKFLRERLAKRLSPEFLEYKEFKEYCISLGYKEGLLVNRIDTNELFTKDNISISETRNPTVVLKEVDFSYLPNFVEELEPRRYGSKDDIVRILKLECTKCGTHYDTIFRKSKHSLFCPSCVDTNRALSFEVGEPIGTNGITFVTKSELGNSYSIMKCGYCNNIFEAVHTLYSTDSVKSCGCLAGKSSLELHLKSFIQSLNIPFKANDRTIIKPKELDLIIPSHKLAIEFNGLFWHSELQGKDRKYHIDKTNSCKESGYELIHIFEHQWKNKQEIVKDIIKKRLGLVENKLFARKCQLREVETNEARTFLEENHLQGYANATYKIGLYYDNELVSIMTFGKSRYDKKVDWELIRFANKLGTNVLGGASKILKYFRTNYKGSLVSYCDISIFSGNLYKQLGFEFSHLAKPNYFYFDSMRNVYSRVSFQKHKLRDKLANFNPTLSEWDNMLNNDFNRYWDCGNAVYILN